MGVTPTVLSRAGKYEEKIRKKREFFFKKVKLKLTFQLDLLLKDANGGDTTSFVKNGEWDLIGFYNDASYNGNECMMAMIIIITIQYKTIGKYDAECFVNMWTILQITCTLKTCPEIKRCYELQKTCFPLSGLPGVKNIATYEYGSYVDITFTIHIRWGICF